MSQNSSLNEASVTETTAVPVTPTRQAEGQPLDTRPYKKRKLPQDPPEHRSIILDGIHPRDFRELNIIYCCEQCSYFNTETHKCAIGFQVEKHRRENQLKLYDLTGKMALCRSQEID